MKNLILAMIPGVALTACSMSAEPANNPSAPLLFQQIAELCGQAFEGRVTSDDPRDAEWVEQRLVMHVRECSDNEIRIPLHVGDDRSRTWVISIQSGVLSGPVDASALRDGAMLTCSGDCEASWLRLKHDHRHEDGSEDVLTQYGGDAALMGADSNRVEFPADDFSRRLFEREGISASMENTWSITATGSSFTYALDRPGRHFSAEFDLTVPVELPPPPWGAE